MQANLIAPLDVSRAKVGQRLLARAIQEWDGPACRLHVNDLIEGHVSQVVRRSRTEKTSAIHVLFDKANCDNRWTKVSMTLVALIGPIAAPTPPGGASGLGEGPPLSDLPLAIGAGVGNGLEPANGFKSVMAAVEVNQYALAGGMSRKLPTHLLPGQVIDLPHMNLTVGTGVDGASIVWAANRDARLEGMTTLVFSPQPVTPKPAPAGSVSPTETQPAFTTHPADSGTARAIGVVDAANETEICSGGCNALSSSALRGDALSTAEASLPIARLGFAPQKRLALSFDHETVITYLDEHHLLCTFDPHGLRERSNGESDAVHTVRAVVIDPATQQITRVLDWRVRGSESYLWPFGQGEVLLHLGHELRLLDANLQTIKSIPVDGPVAWVVSSPSRDHVAVAVVHQRDQLITEEEKDLIQEPDRDLEVRVYDADLNFVAGAIRAMNRTAPVLSDSGELRVARVSSGRWKIVEFGWDKTERTLATVRTSCRPLASSPAHGLVFVTGCMGTTGNTWYRMLRENGRPLLKAESSSDEISQTATGALSDSFAVRVLKSSRPMTVDQPYDRADLTKEEIAIYRSSDGARVTSVVTNDFILAQDSYALSPAGDQMAVLGRDAIHFFDVKRHP